MGAPAPEASGGVSAASNCARKVTCRGSQLPLPRAGPARPAADADRLKAAANPPRHPASPERRPSTRTRSGSAGLGC
eukprot:1444273-Alexandrium_andersonii.AAC.1